MCSYSYFTGLTNVKQIGEGGGGVIPEPKVFVKQANIILHSFYVQSEFLQNLHGADGAPFFVFMPFWYSASRPSPVSRRVLLSSLRVSLFFSKSACLPLKPPLLPLL